jgi:hypothetical protein
MTIDKMKIKDKATATTAGPEVKPEKLGQHFVSPMHHGNGCLGHMLVYFEENSKEIRVSCTECSSAYTLARMVDGSFHR